RHYATAAAPGGRAPPETQLPTLPERAENLVVQLAGVEAVEAAAPHALLDEEHLAAGRPRCQQHPGHPHAALGGEEGEERLVLDLALAGDERHLVLEAPKGEEAPEPHQQVGAALLPAQDLHEQLLAVGPPPDEADVAAS